MNANQPLRPTPLTAKVHERLRSLLKDGDTALDATAGNGYDTLFLARAVGHNGRVLAIDRQAEALATSRERLRGAFLLERVQFAQACHSRLGELALMHHFPSFSAIVFNLGYLPGGDKRLCTQASTTVSALEAALPLLKPSGVLSVMCYPGHEEGAQETRQIKEWAQNLTTHRFKESDIEWTELTYTHRPAPAWLWIRTPNARLTERVA